MRLPEREWAIRMPKKESGKVSWNQMVDRKAEAFSKENEENIYRCVCGQSGCLKKQ